MKVQPRCIKGAQHFFLKLFGKIATRVSLQVAAPPKSKQKSSGGSIQPVAHCKTVTTSMTASTACAGHGWILIVVRGCRNQY